MEKKINIAELLKDCPKGMELDCLMYDNVTFVSVVSSIHTDYPIRIKTGSGFRTALTKYGQNIINEDAKCVIFPKGKTTWEGFVSPKFKVGDIIQNIDAYRVKITEVNVEDECYGYESMIAKGIGGITFSEQDNWEVAPNKFDITTLKPFDKVLVRDNDDQMWTVDMFSFFNRKNIYPFACVGHYVSQCIPYEGNEHLLGTTNDCDNFYKTWE